MVYLEIQFGADSLCLFPPVCLTPLFPSIHLMQIVFLSFCFSPWWQNLAKENVVDGFLFFGGREVRSPLSLSRCAHISMLVLVCCLVCFSTFCGYVGVCMVLSCVVLLKFLFVWYTFCMPYGSRYFPESHPLGQGWNALHYRAHVIGRIRSPDLWFQPIISFVFLFISESGSFSSWS